MARFRRTNLDGKSITETRLTAAALLPGTFAYINEDDAFAQADAPMGRLYIINPGYHQGLGIEDEIPQGSSAVGDYVEEGREFAVRIASGTYLKDQPITVNASGNAEAGSSNIVGYSQESVTLAQTDFLRIRMRTVLEVPAVVSVTVAPETLSIEENEASQLTATILPITANQGITWTSSNDAVAEVDATGLVTGIAAGGPVTITATSTSDPTKSDTCAVTVTSEAAPAVESVTVLPETASIEEGGTEQLAVTVLPVNANQDVTWTTSDPAVATVSETGLVTAILAGPTTITATSTSDPTKSDTCAVTVTSQ